METAQHLGAIRDTSMSTERVITREGSVVESIVAQNANGCPVLGVEVVQLETPGLSTSDKCAVTKWDT